MWAIGSECNRRRTGKVLNQASLRTLARKVELTGIGDLDFANLALIPALSHYKLIEKQEFSPKTQDKLVGQ
jgi:predicted transcriptional regulator